MAQNHINNNYCINIQYTNKGNKMTIYKNYLLNKRIGHYEVYRINLVDKTLRKIGKNRVCRNRVEAKKWVDTDIKIRTDFK